MKIHLISNLNIEEVLCFSFRHNFPEPDDETILIIIGNVCSDYETQIAKKFMEIANKRYHKVLIYGKNGMDSNSRLEILGQVFMGLEKYMENPEECIIISEIPPPEDFDPSLVKYYLCKDKFPDIPYLSSNPFHDFNRFFSL